MASNQSGIHVPESFGHENRFLTIALKKLYLDSTTADVHFIFGDKKKVRIPAHKMLMAASSDTFKSMFYDGLAKDVPNVSIDAFKEFLQFFYFDKVQLTQENIAEVLDLGKTFAFITCLSVCEQFLMDSLVIENVCMCYGLSIRFELNDLRVKCEKIIADKTEAVFNTTDFMKCDRFVLHEILKLDLLSCSECMVFRSCVEWAKDASGQSKLTKGILKEYLNDLLYDIRFRSMTIQEFTILLSTYGDLFSSDQYQEIVQLIVQPNDCQPKLFNGKLRKKHDEEYSIECHFSRDECKATSFYFQDIECIQFTVSKSIMLSDILCSKISISNKEKRLPAELWIYEKSRNAADIPSSIVCHQEITLQSQEITIIPLEIAVWLHAGSLYEIQLKQCPASSQFFSKPFKNEVRINDDVIVKIQINSKMREKTSLICGLNFKIKRNNA